MNTGRPFELLSWAGSRAQAVRSGWRIANLKARQPMASRLMNVKISADVAGAIDQVATDVGASKTEVVIALLNEGLVRAAQRMGRVAPFVLLLALLCAPLAAHATTFCTVKVHGKGGTELSDPGWAEDYWANGQFQTIAQPCIGMPNLTTHADGTIGFDVAFDKAYCGCGNTSYYGCQYLYTPPAGHADPGVYSPYSSGHYGPGDADLCNKSGPYWPLQWPLTAPDVESTQGVMEQINTFLDQTGCTDLTITTHSNGANIIRWGFSQLNTSDFYNNTSCRQNHTSTGAIDPGCEARHQHLVRVVNATSTVIQLHAPTLGSETADLAQWLLSNNFSFITGWLAEWLGGNNNATSQLTRKRILDWNKRLLFGTQANAFPSDLGGTPYRGWPTYSSRGEPLHVARWIAVVSHMAPSLMGENYATVEDSELLSLAGVVSYPPSGESDGLVGWPSQLGVFSGSTDVWYASGQHDSAAAQRYTGFGNNGNNHSHARLGAAGGVGTWRPGVFVQEYCQGWQTCPNYNIGVNPPFLGPQPPPGPGGCSRITYSSCLSAFTCPTWPAPSVYHPIAVNACPDSICARNETRGYPAGADEAFWVSAFIGARAAQRCGPAITYSSNIPNGQYIYYYQNTVNYCAVGGATWGPSWAYVGSQQLFEPPYAPNAGNTTGSGAGCGWAC